jgi:hypothetical protein
MPTTQHKNSAKTSLSNRMPSVSVILLHNYIQNRTQRAFEKKKLLKLFLILSDMILVMSPMFLMERRRRVRFEFEKNRLLTNQADISFQLEKGSVFLQKKLLV